MEGYFKTRKILCETNFILIHEIHGGGNGTSKNALDHTAHFLMEFRVHFRKMVNKVFKVLINLALTDSDKWDKTAQAKSYIHS